MPFTYTKIDSNYYSKLNPKLQVSLNKFIKKLYPDGYEGDLFFELCPYCKSRHFLVGKEDARGLPYCFKCGAIDPYSKLKFSFKKADCLLQIAISIEDDAPIKDDVDKKRVLLEQCIVIIATGLEVFLRDIYATTLNMNYVKDHLTLYPRFYSDNGNDFLNIGKANKKFNEDLNIDLKALINQDNFKKLNLLLLHRNVIVHNNGKIDHSYIQQSGNMAGSMMLDGEPMFYSGISPFLLPKDVEDYLAIVKDTSEKILQVFNSELEEERTRILSMYVHGFIDFDIKSPE